MVSVTNNVHRFLGNETGEIILYGAGNSGYWVGYYLNRCEVDYTCYIDAHVDNENSIYNGKPVYLPKYLKEYRGKHIRIIVTPAVYKDILAEILWMDHVFGIDALCLIPRYMDFITHQEEYNINKLLGYFRRKLFVGSVPTIISNICTAGQIYNMMDMPMLSPTINTGIDAEDFLKLCRNLGYYLGKELVIDQWERDNGIVREKDSPVGRVEDISIAFVHSVDEENPAKTWNVMRERINWDRLIFVMAEHQRLPAIPFRAIREFDKLPGRKLFVGIHNSPTNNYGIHMKENYFSRKDSAIENYFDLLGWLNGDMDIDE